VSDSARILASACAGAIVGAVCGWVYFTDNGRRVRDQVAAIDHFVGTLRQTRADLASAKTDVAASFRKRAS
jgi:hypothetical protein